MIETCLGIEAVTVVEGGEDLVAEARAKYKSVFFPGRSARRMTHLGMLVSLCLRKMVIGAEVPVFYASGFGESESLEKFIDSFPTASPALFQTSIHPSAVEQALIPQKQALQRFYPITGDTNLAGQALENCFLLGGTESALLGGEERGTWLSEHELASNSSFAFGLQLSRGGEGAHGCISIDRSGSPPRIVGTEGSLPEFFRAIQRREAIRVPSFALDAWIRVDWA